MYNLNELSPQDANKIFCLYLYLSASIVPCFLFCITRGVRFQCCLNLS